MKINIKAIAVSFAVTALMLSSCNTQSVTNSVPDTAAADENEVISDSVSDTDSAMEDFDFSAYFVNRCIILSVGDSTQYDGAPVAVQNPDVAEADVESGVITAKSSGVTLIAFDGGEDRISVIACCVLGEGVEKDHSGSEPEVHAAGDTAIMSGGAKGAVFISSDESVVSVDDDGKIYFLSPGYAVVTAEGVSVPMFYSYVVYGQADE